MSVTQAPPGETQQQETVRGPRPSVGSALRSAEFDLRTLGMVGLLVVIWIGFHFMSGGTFLTPRTPWNLSVQFAPGAIICTGLEPLVVSRRTGPAAGSRPGAG